MKFWENRRTAKLIMIAVIIASILLGAHRTLVSMSNNTAVIFYNGVDNDGYGIQSDLDRIIDSSSNLITMAALYMTDDDIALLDDAKEAVSNLGAAGSISAKYQAYLDLDAKISLVYYALENYDLSTAHQTSRTTLFYDIQGAEEQIGHNGYNQYVDDYNAKLTVFPADILARLTFVDTLEAFR